MNLQTVLSYLLRVFLFPLFKKLETVIIPVLAKEAVEFIQHELVGESGDNKKKIAIDYIMSNIKLPLLVKPFKGLIKSQIKNTIDINIDSAVIELKKKLAS